MTTVSVQPVSGHARPKDKAMVKDPPKQLSLGPTDPGYKMKSWGLVITRTLTFDECLKIGKQLSEIEDGTPWWQGDLINLLETNHGEKYSQALDAEMGTYEQLRMRCSVCERIPLARRRKERWVKFSHHAKVAKLEEKDQDRLLAKCATEKWTVGEIEEEANKIVPAVKRLKDGTPKETFHEFWHDYKKTLEPDVAEIVQPLAKKIWETALTRGRLE